MLLFALFFCDAHISFYRILFVWQRAHLMAVVEAVVVEEGQGVEVC